MANINPAPKGNKWVKCTATSGVRSNKVKIGSGVLTGRAIKLYGSTQVTFNGVLEVYDMSMMNEGISVPSANPAEPYSRGLSQQLVVIGPVGAYDAVEMMKPRPTQAGELSFFNTSPSTATIWIEVV